MKIPALLIFLILLPESGLNAGIHDDFGATENHAGRRGDHAGDRRCGNDVAFSADRNDRAGFNHHRSPSR